MPHMTDFVFKFYGQKLKEYQEKKRVRRSFFFFFFDFDSNVFQQEELSRYDPERDLPYDPSAPSIDAPKERQIDENPTEPTSISSQYVPSRQFQVSGTSFQHDLNIASSTIENLDDDDDGDVYDPQKPTIVQEKIKTNEETAMDVESKSTDGQVEQQQTDASEDDLNKVRIFNVFDLKRYRSRFDP